MVAPEHPVHRRVIRSTSARSPPVRTQPTAPALDRTYAAEVAPAMTDASFGRPASHDIDS
jgi:hypothetical protein